MSDHQWKILISAYADGEISPEDIVRAERVLIEVPEARLYLNEIKRLSMGLGVYRDVEGSPDMDHKVLKVISGKNVAKAPATGRPGAVILAMCLFVVIGGVVLDVYIKRGVQGRLKSATDDIGEQYSTLQYEPYYSKTTADADRVKITSSPVAADNAENVNAIKVNAVSNVTKNQ